MAFAGHVGLSLNVDLLVTEGDGISDSRADMGDSKNWAGQVGERRNELTLKALFNEELGAVLQVRTEERDAVIGVLRAHGLSKHSHVVGKTNDRGLVEVWRDAKAQFSAPLQGPAPGLGRCGLAHCPRPATNPACADSEHAAVGAPADTGLQVQLSFDPSEDVSAPFLHLARPKLAILREQGVNSHLEMSLRDARGGF